MKKTLFALIGTAALALSLASCSSNSSFTFDSTTSSDKADVVDNSNNKNNSSNNSNTDTTSNTASKLEPNYQDITVDLTALTDQNTSTGTAVETAVSKIYDSVVSLTCQTSSGSCAGSGVIFAKDANLGFAYIVTCNHVIEGSTSITATLTDGTTLHAQVVGAYDDDDLAVIAVKPDSLDDLTYAKIFEDSDTLLLGSQVVCIGNPLGTLPGSVAVGYVSYLNRRVLNESYKYQKLIQTDVSINSGNSGGGLFNTYGNLIGIVNAKYASSSIEGLGFAVPSNIVQSVVKDIFETAKYDSANDEWSCGYYKGDWEFGFSLSYQNGGFMSSGEGLYISSFNSNDTGSGKSELADMKAYFITTIDVDYADASLTDVSGMSFSSTTAFYTKLYNMDLSVGDKVTFNFKSGKSIDFELKQYVYTF